MPTPSEMRLPIPKSPYEFESICLDYIKCNYPYSNAQQYGRQGQNQHGIDIYGGNFELLVQCKNYYISASTNASQKAQNLIRQIATDYNAAKTYFPKYKQFIVMTTFDRDTEIQNYVADLGGNTFVLFWDDIESFLCIHPNIFAKYYNSPLLQIDTQALNQMIAISTTLKSYAKYFYDHRFHNPFKRESADISIYNKYVEMYNLTHNLLVQYSSIAVQTINTSISKYVEEIRSTIPLGYEEYGNGESLFVLTDILCAFNSDEKLNDFNASCDNIILEIKKICP